MKDRSKEKWGYLSFFPGINIYWDFVLDSSSRLYILSLKRATRDEMTISKRSSSQIQKYHRKLRLSYPKICKLFVHDKLSSEEFLLQFTSKNGNLISFITKISPKICSSQKIEFSSGYRNYLIWKVILTLIIGCRIFQNTWDREMVSALWNLRKNQEIGKFHLSEIITEWAITKGKSRNEKEKLDSFHLSQFPVLLKITFETTQCRISPRKLILSLSL